MRIYITYSEYSRALSLRNPALSASFIVLLRQRGGKANFLEGLVNNFLEILYRFYLGFGKQFKLGITCSVLYH